LRDRPVNRAGFPLVPRRHQAPRLSGLGYRHVHGHIIVDNRRQLSA